MTPQTPKAPKAPKAQSNSYPLAISSWNDEEVAAIHGVIDSDMYTMGAKVKSFESEFARHMGVRHAIMVNSGSSANLIAVAAMSLRKNGPKLEPGDEVIVPAVSWPTTYYPLSQYGCTLKFVDIDIDTLNYDIEALKTSVTSKTKAIVVVNLLGNANDFDTIMSLATKHNLLVFEDNCESLGAKYNGKFAGTFGIAGTYSGFFSHHISTMEGGLVTTDDTEMYHLMLSLRAHGWTRNLPKDNELVELSEDAFVESFRFILPGYNLRPLEMSGAIGSIQLKKLDGFIDERRKNGEKFLSLLQSFEHIKTQKELGESSWFGFSMVLDPAAGKTNRDLAKVLTAHKIDCRPIVAGNFTKNPVMEHIPHTIHGKLPNAELIDSYGLFVGNHHVPMDDMFVLLEKALREFWSN